MVLTFCLNISQDALRSSRKRETLDACIHTKQFYTIETSGIEFPGGGVIKRDAAFGKTLSSCYYLNLFLFLFFLLLFLFFTPLHYFALHKQETDIAAFI